VNGLTLRPGDGELTASWEEPLNDGPPVRDYLIQLDAGNGFATITDGVGTDRSFVVEGLKNGDSYRLRVAAINDDGTGAFSSAVRAVPAASVGFSVTEPAAYRVFQRANETGGAFGLGEAAAGFRIDASEAIPQLEMRLRDAADGSVLADWHLEAENLPQGGTDIEVTLPARKGWFVADFRAGNDTVLGQNPIAAGRVIAVAGQSLATRLLNDQGETGSFAALGLEVPEHGAVYATFSGPETDETAVWAPPNEGGFGSEYSSAFLPAFLSLQAEASGVTCAVVGHAQGGASAWTFRPSGSNGIALASVLGEVGGFEAFIWFQGHSDRGTSDYGGILENRFAEFAGYNALRGQDFDRIVATIPNVQHPAYAEDQEAILSLRASAKAWCEANGAAYVQPHDIEMDDTLHQNQAGNITLAGHFHRASLPGLGLGEGHLGPQVTGGSRSGTIVTLDVTHRPGGTTLIGEGSFANLFSLVAVGEVGPPLSIAQASVSDDTVTLELAEDPGASELDLHVNLSPDRGAPWADNIYDDRLGGDGLGFGRPLETTLAPVRITAMAAPATVPAAIDDLSVAAGDGEALASWTAPGDGSDPITDYHLEISEDGGATFTQVNDGVSDVPGATLGNLVNGTEYHLRVRAENGVGLGEFSEAKAFIPAAAATGGDTPVGRDIDTSSAGFAPAGAGFGQALANSRVELGSGLAPGGSNTFTVECRLRPANDDKDQIALSDNGRWWIGKDGNETWFRILEPGGAKIHLARRAAPMLAGQWYHAALVCGPSGCRVFLDGTEIGSTTSTVTTSTGGSPGGCIGGLAESGTFDWEGEIDEIAVFDHERYAAGFTPPQAPYTGSEPGLVELWHLDGDGLSARV
jgi:hypothetical protein